MILNRVSSMSLAVLAGMTGLAAPAVADISDVVLRIEATNAMGTAVYEGFLSDGTWYEGGEFRWNTRSTINLVNDAGLTIATLSGANVRVIEDPVIQLNFSVVAGSLDTVFTISSPLLSFPVIDPAEGRASAGVTVTDTNGNGATISPSGQPGLYRANYNGANLFADLITGPVTAVEFDSATGSDSSPGGGAFAPIGSPLVDQSARFQFLLTAGDEASGTSNFETRLVPAPGALALLGLGGLIAARRRRN